MAESFFRSFDLPVTIVRPFNTYGPRQSARAIIPTIITQLLSGINEISLGDLSPTRDFLFVSDTVTGFIEIANTKSLIGQDCNIATNSEISMQELVDTIIDLINPSAKIIKDLNRIRPQKSEVFRLYGDNQKIINKTNWSPQHDLRSGLTKTINWFSIPDNLKHYKPGLYNI